MKAVQNGAADHQDDEDLSSAPSGIVGVPGGRSLEPFAMGDDGHPIALDMPPLVDAAPILNDTPPAERVPTEPPPPVERYIVETGGNAIVDGCVVNMRVGKILDGRSFNIQKLKEHPTIKLRKLED